MHKQQTSFQTNFKKILRKRISESFKERLEALPLHRCNETSPPPNQLVWSKPADGWACFCARLQIMQHLTDHTLHRTPLVTDLSVKIQLCFIHDDCIREPDHNIQRRWWEEWRTLLLLTHNVHFEEPLGGGQKRKGSWVLAGSFYCSCSSSFWCWKERRRDAALGKTSSSTTTTTTYLSSNRIII